MAEQVVMSQQQLEQLLRSISVNPNPTAVTAPVGSGNFAQCKSRYSGSKEEDVEAFINAISIYKECVNVNDANALRGLPMLLDKLAATWWQGTKDSITTWEAALTALRHAFGINKPAHKIFREFFS
ncbi:hypothetical protein RN001_003410 [Aquatica leii]|uniref:Uncharacterized protein n=1 Tax=Aquatica leii TaxID=1421715 RepID=A0AAN7PI97_9COLE|nr:hypothetical protein RN001_003410 [Aquatica leii]